MNTKREGASLKTWWQRRAATKQAINGEPEVLADFLRYYPQQEQHIVTLALRRCESFATWDSLQLALGLVSADSPRAVEVLKKLIDHNKNPELRREYPVRWEQLEEARLVRLFQSLQNRGEHAVADELLMQLPIDRGLQMMPPLGDAEFLTRLGVYLQSHTPINGIIDWMTADLEERALSGTAMSEENAKALTNCLRAAEQIWDAGKVEEALDVLTTLALVKHDVIPRDVLTRIVNYFKDCYEWDWVDECLNVVRAANLLRRFPSSAWVLCLKNAWIEIAFSARIRSEEGTEEYLSNKISPAVAAAANSLAVALGTCAAHDPNYTTLELEAPTSKELEALIEARNGLVDQHNQHVRDFQTQGQTDRELTDQIIELLEQIHDKEERIEALKMEQMGLLSPGYLLLIALLDGQANAAEVRQGAAWGLWKLFEMGNLDDASNRKIADSIHKVVSEFDDSELLKRLNSILLNDERFQPVFEAALDYVYSRNFQRFATLLEDLSLSEDIQREIVTVVRACTSHELSHDFRERRIQFLPGQRLLELEQTLLDGLVWMADLVEPPEDDEETAEDVVVELPNPYQNVRAIVKGLREYIPTALEFLSRYPLRLMTLETHKRMLGQYSRTRSDVTLWTRYSPPIWRRGARPEEVGAVHLRYLALDDRSTPNAMGIYYRLFAHPILALPVIYHEHLHYGGPTGKPDAGIENETEVLLREILFARGLIAQLAPADDEDLPFFEHELIDVIRAASMEGLLLQLGYDFRDDRVLAAICEQIEETYGRQLTPDEARQQIDHWIAIRNRNIELDNLTNEMKRNWYPEIEWPYLHTEPTRYLTEEYRQILHRGLTSDHRIDTARCDRILEDPVSQKSIAAWEAYKRRNHALEAFSRAQASPRFGMSSDEILTYIVNRIGPLRRVNEADFDVSGLARLFANLGDEDVP